MKLYFHVVYADKIQVLNYYHHAIKAMDQLISDQKKKRKLYTTSQFYLDLGIKDVRYTPRPIFRFSYFCSTAR
jgi:hypothetical protein